MVPKFGNPHSLSQDVEITTRSEIAERAGVVSASHGEDNQSLKRDLDNMLRAIWADTPTETSGPSKAKKRRKIITENKDDKPALFRLVSNTSYPRHICLDPKPLPSYISRGPDCEDDEAQADTRRIRALSVAVDFESLLAVSKRQVDPKPIVVETKVVLGNTPLAAPLPPLLVTEESRTSKAVRRVATRNQQSSPAASPHESRPSCVVLPVTSVPEQREVAGKKRKRRKIVKERPSPAYWRPSSDLRGKCMGYALGYPSNWAPERAYVRDVMKRGVDMSCCARQ